MAITLHSKYANKLGEVFSENSFIKGRLSEKYDFSGVKTVRVMTPLTVPMVAYNRSAASNRYGTPTEMQDIVQELTLTQDRAFSLVVDKGNYKDQGHLKEAGRMLKAQIKERAIPEMDKYVFEKLALTAGNTVVSTAPTASTIVGLVATGTEKLDDMEVPSDKRILFVNAAHYKLIKGSTEFLGIDDLGLDAVKNGAVGTLDGMTVVKVPASRWPTYLCFLIVQKDCATAPVKIDETKLHIDPPGYSGNLLEGRQYYDCFVFGHRCDGVYSYWDGGTNRKVKTTTPTIAASGGAFSGVTGGTYHFTTDGSDPRYSMTVKTGSGSDITTAGTVVKCYATKTGEVPSAVATQTLT